MAAYTFSPPPGWAAMEDDDTPPASRDAAWYARCDFVNVDLATPEAKALGALLRRGLRNARVVKLERVQSRTLWAKYEQAQHWIALREEGDANEQLLFHGTCALAPADVCASDEGIDPRFSDGGFYDRGTYLAESAGYPVGGRRREVRKVYFWRHRDSQDGKWIARGAHLVLTDDDMGKIEAHIGRVRPRAGRR